MGSSSSEPLYCLHPLPNFHKPDCLPIKYMWLDKNIDNYENKSYYQKFSKDFNISRFNDLLPLQHELKQLNMKGYRVRIISSASFQDPVYDWIQSNQMIEKAALFCGNQTKAGILMRNFPKIKSACYVVDEVLMTLKFWEREEERNIYFFEEKDKEALHLVTICWHSLTDIDQKITPNMKDNFFKYCHEVLKDSSPLDNKNPSNSKLVDSASLITYALEKYSFLEEINSFFRETNDPTKLAYIRWPVYHLFNFIKSRYLEMKKSKGSITLYGVIYLNSFEKRQLEPDKIINIVQFIKATNKSPDRKSCETIIQIEVGANQQICNGYYTASNGALFNIGNFYKVKGYDEKNNNLTVELLAFSNEDKIQKGDNNSQVLLNQLRIRNMEVLKEGQWYSLILSGKKTETRQYLGRVDALQKKQGDLLENAKWLLVRQKVKVRIGFPIQESLKELEHCMRTTNDDTEKIVLLLTALAQISLSQRKTDKFQRYFLELSNLLESPKGLKIKKEPYFNAKIDLMRIVQTMVQSNYNWKEAAKEIQRFQQSLIVRSTHKMASGLYLFCLQMKAFCYQLLEDYKSELEVLDLIIWILSSVFGHENYRLKKLLLFKKETFEKIDPKQSESELQMKKKMLNSKVSLSQLLARNSLLNIDVSGIEITQSPIEK